MENWKQVKSHYPDIKERQLERKYERNIKKYLPERFFVFVVVGFNVANVEGDSIIGKNLI